MLLSLHAWWSMAFGLGLSPVARGTMGTLLGVVFAALLSLLPRIFSGCILLFLTLYSIWAAAGFATDLQLKDPSAIVSDEVVGFMWAVFGLPCTLSLYLYAFLLFRFFDITKLGPIGWLDRQDWPGWSIVLDDCCAGLFSWICLWFMIQRGFIYQ